MNRTFAVAMLFALGWAASAEAGGCCCPSCGCSQVKKICVCVPDVKKETKYEYSAVCEDFCIPGPSRIVGHCHTKDCRGCDVCKPIRQPTCADVKSRMKLVKIPVTCETPTVKWIVKTVCCKCGTCCGHHGHASTSPGATGAPAFAESTPAVAPRPIVAASPISAATIIPLEEPTEEPGVPPLPPPVPGIAPASYSSGAYSNGTISNGPVQTGSSTLIELLSAESK